MDLCQEQGMKKAISISAVGLILLSLYFARLRQSPKSVHAAEGRRAAFLILLQLARPLLLVESGSKEPGIHACATFNFDHRL